MWRDTTSLLRKRSGKLVAVDGAEGLLCFLVAPPVVVEQAHAKAERTFRHRRADSAHAHQSERLVAQLEAQQRQRFPAAPTTPCNQPVPLQHPAAERQDQRPGEVGGGVGQHPGRVCDRDAAPGAGADVHVVVAGPVVGDHAEPGACRSQQFVVDQV